MRIAHVTATFPPYYAGTGNVCYHSALHLSKMGHEVTVYTTRWEDEARDESYAFAVERLRPLLSLGNAALLPGLLRLPRYDLVHLHYPFILSAELIWLNRYLKNQPYVLTYHNDLRWHGLRGMIYELYQKTAAWRVLRRAERIIVTASDFVQASPYLSALAQVDPPQLTEIPNGVDVTRFHPGIDASQVRERYHLDDGQLVVLFAGAMDMAHHLKGGAPQLLEAVAQLKDRKVRALMVGGGGLVERYQVLARDLGISEQVVFTGWIAHEELGQYYAAADVVVQPSVLMEAFGMVAIEAMACNTPVIVSNLPGARTVVSDGQDGLLVEPGDVGDLAAKLRLLLDDAPLRKEMGARGRAKVEARYAWHRVIPQLVELYEQVLEAA
jgi:glycosyltransferase involved in cell wall biosynthesis